MKRLMADTSVGDRAGEPVTHLPVLVLSGWCGLVSGLIEVAAIVGRKWTFDPNHLYGMSRHFVWLIPVTNLCLFLAIGVVLKIVGSARVGRARWLAPRLLCSLTMLPALLVALPRIHGLASFVVALGIAIQVVPILERHRAGCRWLFQLSFLAAALLVPILAGSLWAGDRINEWRQNTRALPPSDAPNVLLIVLDSAAAEHLSLHGYNRPTSPNLDKLAARGVRFDRAQAASSWTLPSHATMFTGRFPHELSAGWLNPLDRTFPTLAGFLGSKGYATAGFIANILYCARDSGLARGFTTYEDYIFPRLNEFRMASLVDRPVTGLQTLGWFLEQKLKFDLLTRWAGRLRFLLNSDRKEAAVLQREFLDWLSSRRQPERPFFAFLNYYDAHYPYQLPDGSVYRFGAPPRSARQSYLIQNWWQLDKRGLSPRSLAFIRDSYDDCVANLDDHLGRFIDELDRRGVLERTWVLITADHGESFGEHAGVYCHGTSLYQTELHVPLMILPPASHATLAGRTVDVAVSLRDLAATVVDVLGLEADSPFPGKSLARYWNRSPGSPEPDAAAGDAVISEVVPIDPLKPDPMEMLAPHWPLAALNQEGWSYIRKEGEVREELFHLGDDARESNNLAGAESARATIERMRSTLCRQTGGPLTPDRFNP
jgi:arylsulfatase A-like enzyme